MNRYCLTLDLIDDLALIKEYERLHEKIWPEIRQSIIDAGIEDMQIYRFANRLMMIMEVNDSFDFDRKSAMDAGNAKVQEWETLMWDYQKALPGAKPGEKWMLMENIFEL